MQSFSLTLEVLITQAFDYPNATESEKKEYVNCVIGNITYAVTVKLIFIIIFSNKSPIKFNNLIRKKTVRREKVSERSSYFLGFGGKKYAAAGDHGERKHSTRRKDFRENLFSIFIDNVNPKVNVACLWEVFKVFGRVREFFLSTQKGARQSCFAFIRFDSLEEASKVANKVDGMHVYGWPIRAKIAEYGWKSRNIQEKRKMDANKGYEKRSSEDRR
ncbi:hypothetical protein Dsin_006042 [Dipteronia sinensis]|uniref:RRM domain-containing protein n=1 Tax=Dipteronia sinensis TaxID=43782 RepID=A0AAE0EH19_9ROSI|nr:hypothetical protein Dsin_006042 [Dipteronia sinensis]